MKKGLLSLLALALTVVGCQNYDDQFDELTSQITSLQSTVDGLSGVTNSIATLQNTVAGLSTTVGELTNYDDTGVVAQLDSVSSTLASLLAQLSNVATSADLNTITASLAEVEKDLTELLAANAVINQNITINNVATLEYVESLISTDEDDPNVIVNGTITVETDEADFDAAQMARVNAVAAKIATSLKTVTITNTYSPTLELTFSSLGFVDNDLIVSGSTNLANASTSDDKLRTVSGDFTISNVTTDLDLSLLTNADDTTVPGSITSLNLGIASLGSIQSNDGASSTSSSTGELLLPKATSVNTGKAVISHLVAAKATDIDITSAVTSTIAVKNAATLDILGAGKSYGEISITATKSTIAYLSALTAVGTLTVSGNPAQLHLPKLATAHDITADAVIADISKLKSVTNDIEMHKILDFNAPVLDVSGIVSITAATAATVKDVSAGYEFGAPKVKTLTISALADTNSFATIGDGNDFDDLTTLSVTGVADSAPSIGTQTNSVSSTSDVLANVTLGGSIDMVKLTSVAKVASVETSGNIRHFELDGSIATSVDLGHGHIEGSDAATLILTSNSKLASLAPTSLDELGNITVQDNAKLATLNLGSFVTLPQLGEFTITISNTALTGNYVLATEIVTTTAARVERIRSAALASLKPIMTLSAAAANVTYTFAGDIISSVTTSTRSNVNNDIVATSTNTETLQTLLQSNNGFGIINTATKVVTEVAESDFTYIESL